jgi:peptide/nickel transport system substrate-binding protein
MRDAITRRGALKAMAVAVGAGLAGPRPGRAAEDSITVIQNEELASLDPTFSVHTPSRNVYGLLFDALVHRNRQLALEPRALERWERLDATTWRFHVRKGVRFHNGEPLDAQAVKFTFDIITDKERSPAAALFRPIKAVQVQDPYTLSVTTDGPFTFLLDRIADVVFVVPPRYYAEKGRNGFVTAPVGSGPYRYKSWTKGDAVVLAPHADYWGRKPKFREVSFKPVLEPSTRVAALLSGRADIVSDVPTSQARLLQNRPNVTLSVSTMPDVIHIGLRPGHAALKDRRVRQALNYAVDKRAIVERLLQGYAEPVGQPVPPVVFGHDPAVKPYPHDPERARTLLREAGFAGGFEATMEIGEGRIESAKSVAEAVVGDLRAVKVAVSIRQFEFGTLRERLGAYVLKKEVQGGHPDMYLMYNRAPSLDAEDITATFLPATGFWNFSGYANPEMDRLVAQSIAASRRDERERLFHAIARLAHEDAPWLFLYSPQQLFGVRAGLGWKARPDNMIWVHDDID